MKVINKDKIIEAFIIPPYESDPDIPFGGSSHDWQIGLIVGYTNEGYPIQKTIDMANEAHCIEFINKLNFTLL